MRAREERRSVFALGTTVFVIIVLLILGAYIGCAHEKKSDNESRDQCGTEYVTKEVFANINGKEKKIATIKVAECSIKITTTNNVFNVGFKFGGDIIDRVYNNPSAKDGAKSHLIAIMIVMQNNGNVSFANPFEGGYCYVYVAFETNKKGPPVYIKKKFVFNPGAIKK